MTYSKAKSLEYQKATAEFHDKMGYWEDDDL